MRNLACTLAATLVLLSCASSPTPLPYAGTASSDVLLDMAGTFALTARGDLTLTLEWACRVKQQTATGVMRRCSDSERDAIPVVAVTPWADAIHGTWISAKEILFRVDWKHSHFDPLAPDAMAIARRSWSVSGTRWRPSLAEAEQIVALVGQATATETFLVRGGPPPSLEVTQFEIIDGTLRSGSDATLVVKVTNRGAGAAYRVVAITRSSVAALHGQRISFGMIESGTEKTRRVQLRVPGTTTASDTMLVLELSEGNDFAPPSVSKRIPIAGSAGEPILGIRCTAPGAAGSRIDVNAGESFVLQCVVDNTGQRAADVDVVASIGETGVARAPAQLIAENHHATFGLRAAIPRDLGMDASVEITISARDRGSQRSAQTMLVGVVRRPRVCVPGQLTRAQYEAKLSALRAARDAGDITQAAFDRYDAELVSCLK